MPLAVLAVALAITLLASTATKAQSMSAIYTGFVLDSPSAFTLVFTYDLGDLTGSSRDGFLDAKPGTVQTASYADATRSMTFTDPTSFSKGEYASEVYDADGRLLGSDTIHEFDMVTASGTLSVRFGGAGNEGQVSFDPVGNDYVQLDPQSFQVVTGEIAPVPLPGSALLLGGGVALLGLFDLARIRRKPSPSSIGPHSILPSLPTTHP